MKTEHIRIKKLTEEFISESIKHEDPKGLCFATSYPLKIYLLTRNIKSVLRTGKVPMPTPENENYAFDHFWLQIDGDGTILDPTIMQFSGDEKIQIYLGKLDEYDITKNYIVNTTPNKNWFQSVYESWRTPFIDPTYPLNDFTKRSIKYQIRLATILHSEINNSPYPDDIINKYYKDYFTPIFIYLRNWNSGKSVIKIEKENMYSNFENMLSEALELESF